MTLKAYLFLMSLTTVVAWIGWIIVVTMVDPEGAGTLGLVFFYLSLFLSLLGTFSVLGFIIRSLIQRHRHAHVYRVSTAFRQACLWSLGLIIALALQSQRILYWWLLLLLLVAMTMIEFTFIVWQQKRQ
jgi:hypothetical protein